MVLFFCIGLRKQTRIHAGYLCVDVTVATMRVTHDVMNTTRENKTTATRPCGSTIPLHPFRLHCPIPMAQALDHWHPHYTSILLDLVSTLRRPLVGMVCGELLPIVLRIVTIKLNIFMR